VSIDSGHTNRPEYEFIDSRELAARWAVPETWIRERVRTRCEDPLPHLHFSEYGGFRLVSPEVEGWAGQARNSRSAKRRATVTATATQL
jgi:hypothetical protein